MSNPRTALNGLLTLLRVFTGAAAQVAVMTQPLEPHDGLHLKAAEGWIGLGDCASANDELEQIAAASRPHPDVLQFRWEI